MSFTVRCPFCKSEMDCPDDLLGQVGQCPSCGKEIDLDDDRPPARVQVDSGARSASMMRAAAIAAAPTTMPRITWSWAFDAVLKLTVAVLVIDGLIGLAFGILRGLMGGH